MLSKKYYKMRINLSVSFINHVILCHIYEILISSISTTLDMNVDYNGVFLSSGKPMYENKNPWRLLLLCLGSSCLKASTCVKLCQHGSIYDRSNQVSIYSCMCVVLYATNCLDIYSIWHHAI